MIRKILEHMGLALMPPLLYPARGPPSLKHNFEDEFSQQHFEMNPPEHKVRTSCLSSNTLSTSLKDCLRFYAESTALEAALHLNLALQNPRPEKI